MQGAKKLLKMLMSAGFEAYIVGGAVRDILMGKDPHDFDIVTSARPDDVINLLQSANYKTPGTIGKSFGVVLANLPEGTYEIATFRREQYGEDSHRPEVVTYADSLEDDVQRRDFTVNGMAMDVNEQIIDLVGGQKDLRKKILRTIGDPSKRFQEDALRMFRACRFLGQLDFMPDPTLLRGMEASLSRVEGLSLHRVKEELERLLLTPAVAKGLDVLVQTGLGNCACSLSVKGKIEKIPILPELAHLVDLPQERAYHAFDAWYHTLAVVQNSEPDLMVRWAALLHDVAKGIEGVRAIRNNKLTDYGHDEVGASMARDILLRLGYKDTWAERVEWLVRNHMRFHYFANTQEADAYKWMRKEARSGEFRNSAELTEACEQLREVCVADVLGCGRPLSSTEGTASFGDCLVDITQQMPIHTRDLQYDKDLLTITGEHTGEILKWLVLQVQNGQVDNTPEALRQAVEKKIKRYNSQRDGEINGTKEA